MFDWLKKTESMVLSFFDENSDILIKQDTKTFEKYYENNGILFAGINLIKNTSLRFDFYDNNKLINFPIDDILHHLLISGNCFIYKNKEQLELMNFHNLSMNINPQKDDFHSIIYKNKTYLKSEILHLKFQKSLNDICGISPIKALQKNLEIYKYLMNFVFKIIKNDGRASGIFTTSQLSNNQFLKTQNDIQDIHNRIKHNEHIGLIQGDLSWQKIGMDFKELQILELKQNIERDICYGLNIPPRLLGVTDSNMTGYSDAIKQCNKHVENYLLWIIKDLNHFLKTNITFKYKNIGESHE